MKKKLIYLGLIFLALLVQLSFLPALINPGAMGDAVLMLVLAIAVLDGFAPALNWAIVAGLLYDFASFGLPGQYVIIFLLLVYAVSFFSRRLSVEVKGIWIFLLFLFVITAMLISKSLLILFFMSSGQSVNFLQALGGFKNFVFQAGCNMVLFFFWFNAVRKVKRILL